MTTVAVARGPRAAAGLPGTLLALLVQAACATIPPAGGGAPSAAPGYRAVFRGLTEGPGAHHRFSVAVAILPPDRLRLEFFAPVGGARFVLVSHDDRLLALDLSRGTYERDRATAEAVDRLVGLPLAVDQAIAILMGRPICPPETGGVKAGAPGGDRKVRGEGGETFTCATGSIIYRGVQEGDGSTLQRAEVRDVATAAIMLQVTYGGNDPADAGAYPRRIHLSLRKRQTTVTLQATEGPLVADVPEALFRQEVPEGFTAGAAPVAVPFAPAAPSEPR